MVLTRLQQKLRLSARSTYLVEGERSDNIIISHCEVSKGNTQARYIRIERLQEYV